MKITDVRLHCCCNSNRLKAMVSVTLDHCFAIHEIKIIQGDERLFLAMPSTKTADGRYRDIVHPIGSEMRETLEQEVLKAYEEQQDCVTFDFSNRVV